MFRVADGNRLTVRVLVPIDPAHCVVHEEAAHEDPPSHVVFNVRVATLGPSRILDQNRNVDKVVIVVTQVELEEVVLDSRTLKFVR